MGKTLTSFHNISNDNPYILYQGHYRVNDLEKFRKDFHIWKVDDIYEAQLNELFEITHANLVSKKNYSSELQEFVKKKVSGQTQKIKGNWIYFPWSGRLVHALIEEDYNILRTNRNRNLITLSEQKRLLNFRVAIAGLSVGSNVATALAYGGIANAMKLSESDILETTNLNRIRARIDQIGTKKINITAQQIYEINPYAELVLTSSLTKNTLKDFISKGPRPQIIFEIIDSFAMKIHLRNLAKKFKIPVVMVTNLGDSVLIDVERYDQKNNLKFFNGRAGSIPDAILRHPDLNSMDKHRYAVSLAGQKNIPQRAIESVHQIGHTLVGRPQLSSTVTIAAGLCSYITRKIALGEKLPSQSWILNLENISKNKNILKML